MPCGCFKLFEMSSQTFLFYVFETRDVFNPPPPERKREKGRRRWKIRMNVLLDITVYCGREAKNVGALRAITSFGPSLINVSLPPPRPFPT